MTADPPASILDAPVVDQLDDTGSRATSQDPTGPERRHGLAERLAAGLGWFSLALGVPQLVAPGRVNRLVGVEDTPRNRAIMRGVGLRELGGGAGVLTKPRPGAFLAARVAGDAVDLALLGAAARSGRGDPGRARTAALAVAGVTLLDAVAARANSRTADPTTPRGAVRARSRITVNRSPDEAYGYWRDMRNLPRFMTHLEEVEVIGGGLSRWVAAAPVGRTVAWRAELVEDEPGRRLSWRSLDGSEVPNRGSVDFTPAPGGRGTEVTVDLVFEPPAGAVGAAVARLFGEDPAQQVKDDLRRFKQVLEAGGVVRSDGTPEGTRTGRLLRQRPARPTGAAGEAT